MVNKISQPNLKPNLGELLDANRFDLIINIPMDRQVTQTDGKVNRQKAVEHNVSLVTSVPVAQEFINKLDESKKAQSHDVSFRIH